MPVKQTHGAALVYARAFRYRNLARVNANIMAMTVGVARVTLYLEETFSLKDKRQVVRSITQKVRNQFNAGIAEVEDLDDARAATLAIVVVSNSANHAQEMLQTIIGFIERRVELGVLGEVETELIPFGD
jgi:uncharacterized protein YlxP (DUF503 family)